MSCKHTIRTRNDKSFRKMNVSGTRRLKRGALIPVVEPRWFEAESVNLLEKGIRRREKPVDSEDGLEYLEYFLDVFSAATGEDIRLKEMLRDE